MVDLIRLSEFCKGGITCIIMREGMRIIIYDYFTQVGAPIQGDEWYITLKHDNDDYLTSPPADMSGDHIETR